MLEFVITNEEDGSGWYYPTADQKLILKKDGDKLVAENQELCFGLCEYLEEPTEEVEAGFSWVGYGHSNISMSQVTAVATEMPVGLKTEKWAEIYNGGAQFVDVAVTDDKVYIEGLLPSASDAVAVGDIKDGKVTIPAGYFLGINDAGYYSYLYGGRIDTEFSELYQQEISFGVPEGDLVFAYITVR